MAKKLQIKGAIICNDEKWIYDWYEMDSTCPNDVSKALNEANGEPIITEINSGGGDIFVGSEINALLRGYEGEVTQNILGLAGSAASVIAMARTCYIAPTAMMMIHNVACTAKGDYHAMEKTIEILKKANEAMANAYIAKTGKSMEEALAIMDKESWYTSREAKESGLVDGIMFEDDGKSTQLVAGIGSNLLPREVIDKMKAEKIEKLNASKKQALQNKLNSLGGLQC